MTWIAASSKGYSSPKWGSYKQWSGAGRQVKKGEKSTVIFFSQPVTETIEKNGKEIEITRWINRTYSVFNFHQTSPKDNNIIDEGPESNRVILRVECADEFVKNTFANIIHGGERAYYSPYEDSIHIPHRHQFIGDEKTASEGYYGTLLHELVHWTGAAGRKDRNQTGRKYSEEYAYEELVAELGATFLCAEFGIEDQPRPDHVSYIQSWVRLLKDHNRAILDASREAEAAIKFLRDMQPR